MATTLDEVSKSFSEIGERIKNEGITSGKTGAVLLAPTATTKTVSADTAQPETPPMFNPPEAVDTSASIKSDLEKQRKAVEDAYQAELDRIRSEKQTAQTEQEKFTKMINTALGEAEPLTAPFREDLEASERKRLKVEENYFANQSLVNELDGLLTESIEMTRKLDSMKVPGLAGLQQSERLIKAKEGVQSRIAVVQAVMAARNNQIGTALNFIDRTTNAITQDRQDRLNYLNTLVNWYDKQRTEEGNKVLELSKDEKAMIDKQIGLLEGDLKRAQAVSDKIKDIMITDPQLVAESGLSLNDSLEGASKKLADAKYAREVKTERNTFEQNGYQELTETEALEKPIGQVIAQTDSRGNTKYYWKDTGLISERVGSFEVLRDKAGNIISQRALPISSKGGRLGGGEGTFNSLVNTVANLETTVAGKEAVADQLGAYLSNEDYDSAYNQIANTVENSLPGETRTRFANARIDREVLAGFKTALEKYQSLGGDMGLLSGTAEEIYRKLGQEKNPELTEIAVQMQREFQTYRNTMTGAAFTKEESAEYASVNPTANKKLDLNLSIINGALNQLNNRVDGTIRAKVPQVSGIINEINAPKTPEEAKSQVNDVWQTYPDLRDTIIKLFNTGEYDDFTVLDYLKIKGLIQ